MKSTTMEKLKKKNPQPAEEQEKKKDNSAAQHVDGRTAIGAVPIEKLTASEEVQPPNPLDNPFFLIEKALERKLHNLEKRQVYEEWIGKLDDPGEHKRLEEFKAEKENGSFMQVQQQIETMNKIDEIGNQIEFLREMQKLNKKQLSQYKKCVKARDRELKKQQQQELAHSQTTTPLQTTEQNDQKSSPPQSEKKEQPKIGTTEIESKLKLKDKVVVPTEMPMPESQPKYDKGRVDDDENKENVPIAALVVVDNSWGMGGGGEW